MRERRARGRPVKYELPPRIDATAEELAQVIFRSKPQPFTHAPRYNCAGCGRKVMYPDILYKDRRCRECTAQPLRE